MNWHYFQPRVEEPASLSTNPSQGMTKTLRGGINLFHQSYNYTLTTTAVKTSLSEGRHCSSDPAGRHQGKATAWHLQTREDGITFTVQFLRDAAVMRPQRWPWAWVSLWHKCHSQHKWEPNSLSWGRCESSSCSAVHKSPRHLPTNGMVLTFMLFFTKNPPLPSLLKPRVSAVAEVCGAEEHGFPLHKGKNCKCIFWCFPAFHCDKNTRTLWQEDCKQSSLLGAKSGQSNSPPLLPDSPHFQMGKKKSTTKEQLTSTH